MRGKYERLKARKLSSHPLLYEVLRLDEPELLDNVYELAPPPKRRKSIWKHMKRNKAATMLLIAQVVPVVLMLLYAAIFRTNW